MLYNIMYIMNKLDVFEQFDNVISFFSQKPDRSLDLIPSICRDLGSGEYFIKPHLVHGKHVQVIDEEYLKAEHIKPEGYPELSDVKGYIEVPKTDGLVTDIKGVALVSTHGDCLPIFACDPKKKVIGIAHAGWKGTMLGIAAELVKTMMNTYGCKASDIYTYIGPGIGKCHFEVMEDVKKQFEENLTWSKEFIFPKDEEHYLIDLKGINERHLRQCNIEHIQISEDCTYCLEEKYWSYRRSADKDRMLAYIKIV